jgi:glycosyltransferase involved in cell wall biosynthesis
MTIEMDSRRAGAALASKRGARGKTAPGAPVRISCIVCAYNEADRIRHILDAVYRHPELYEIIVVNDGSTDDTAAMLANYPDIRVLSYSPNRGKTYAMEQGVAAAGGDYLMFLDADLAGVTPADVSALARPVANGWTDVSISLRANSLLIYRAVGLDFVSGERVIPAWLVADALTAMRSLPRWGGEAFINDRICREKLSIAVVKWPAVYNIRKYQKVGFWRGIFAELSMVGDAFKVLSPFGSIRQNAQLLSLIDRKASKR